MIPRTKHLVVGLTVAVFVMVGGLGVTLGERGVPSLSFIPQQALLSDAVAVTPEVVVVRDTTREDARASLRERLQAFVHDAGTPITPSQESASEQVPSEVNTDTDIDSVRCDTSRSMEERNNWGPVNVTVAEGARIVTSLAIDDAGLPLHTIQLPLEPTVTGEEGCLPNDMVGILLDGTVVMPETKIMSDAEGLAGYAFDGFPIFGHFEDGKTLVTADLDACHGHVHTIVNQGVLTSMYHYHLTEDAPYSLGCFRGTSVSD